MKLQLVVIAILATLALQTDFCAAQLVSTSSTVLTGNFGDQIDISPPSDMGSWNLKSGTNTFDGTLDVTATYNWGVEVRSDINDGKMKEYSGTTGDYVTEGRSLIQPLHVICTSVQGWYDSVHGPTFGYGTIHDVQLTGNDQSLIDPVVSPGASTHCGITFSQDVDVSGGHDSRITTPGNRYHIVVIFTGGIHY